MASKPILGQIGPPMKRSKGSRAGMKHVSALDGVLSVGDVLGLRSSDVRRDASGKTYTITVRGKSVRREYPLDAPFVHVENGFYAGQKDLKRSITDMYGITNKRLLDHGSTTMAKVKSKRIVPSNRTKYTRVGSEGKRRGLSGDGGRITLVRVKPASPDKRNAEPILRALGLGALGTSATVMDGPFIRSLLFEMSDLVKVEPPGK